MKEKKCLISGHKGFIGHNLYKKLTSKYQTIGYDLKEGNDTRNFFNLDKFFENDNIDLVVHLAALTGVRNGEKFPEEYISTNITGTQNIVNACKKHGVRKILFYSSSSVLGGNKNKEKGLKETDQYNPQSIYAISKVAGEYIVKNSGLDYIIVRPFTVYGPRGRPDMVIYKWLNQIKSEKPITIYGDGRTSRGYTYVKDLVKVTAKLIEKFWDKQYQQTFHIGGKEQIRLDDLLKLFIKNTVEKKIKMDTEIFDLPEADVIHSYADISKIQKEIDYNPKLQFQKIVNKIIREELDKFEK